MTISAREPVSVIPRSFLGISTEYWTLPVDERHIALYKRVLSLVHVPGDGRLVLRIGGDSSDHAFWDPTRPLAHWVFDITPAWVSRTARLVRKMDLRVIIDLNFVTGTPRLAAAWAREAEAEMPPRSIIGFEIGNEPDLYDRPLWLFNLGHATFDEGLLPIAITPDSYAREYGAYARALALVAPRVPLLAPALANPDAHLGWISTLLIGPHPDLGVVSAHWYPYSACVAPSSPEFPTISRVLSGRATTGIAQSIRPAVRLAHAAGLPVRLTELNSVTCGGLDGVSNTFATALWAPDALFELARAGVEGVNLHVRVFSINSPFRFDIRGVRARPLLYGMILFTRMLGPDSRLVPVQLHIRRYRQLKVWAVRVGKHTLHVLLLDKGPASLTVNLHLPATGTATVQRLLAPSASSKSQVTLAGQMLDQDASWQGKPITELVTPGEGGYVIRLRRFSAALLTVHVASTTLALRSGPVGAGASR